MLTRRTALGVLPAVALLDDSIVTPAQAQTCPPPSSVAPDLKFTQPKNSDILSSIYQTQSGFTVGLPQFVERAQGLSKVPAFAPYIQANFAAEELDLTKRILDLLVKVFDYRPDSVASFKDFAFRNPDGSVSGAIIESSKVRDYVLVRLASWEGNTNSPFGARINGLKGQAEYGWQGPGDDFKAAWPKAMTMSDLLSEIDLRSRDIASYLVQPTGTPAWIPLNILLSNDDSTTTENRKRQAKDNLFTKVDALWRAGYDAATISPVAFPVAVQAYAVYNLILRLFREPAAYGRHAVRARARVIEKISNAYDFFDFGLSDLKTKSDVVRRAINGLHLNDDKTYMGCELKSDFIADGATKINNPAIKLANRCQPFRGDSEAQVYLMNYYLVELGNAGFFGPAKTDDPFEFDVNPIAAGTGKVQASKDFGAVGDSTYHDLNDLGKAAAVSRLPRFAAGTDTLALDVDGPQSNNLKDLNGIARQYLAKVNERMDEVVKSYGQVQIYFNLMERMTWSLLQMLTRGGS